MTAPMTRPRRVNFQASARRNNLPALHTQLFGREQDSATVRELTLQTLGRLVTLTGTGGCGKTQLALLVATSLIDAFPDGVWLVDLAPVETGPLVPQAVMSALGMLEQPREAPSQTLAGWIRGRSMLLVLDNCEHLLDACAELAAALLDACPSLRLLTTSREPLRISGERVWRVPSLGIPEPRSTLSPDQVAKFPAPQLFVQRAQALKSDFAVTSHNAAVVSAICARLEGLPLAIELAAAWVRVLGVDQIQRLDDTYELLVGGSRSAPSRQQTMRATMDWSYGLLTEAQRVVFQRLAVFVGGWSLEAAEDVCSGGKIGPKEVLDLDATTMSPSGFGFFIAAAHDFYATLIEGERDPARHCRVTYYAHANPMYSEMLLRWKREHLRALANLGAPDVAGVRGEPRSRTAQQPVGYFRRRRTLWNPPVAREAEVIRVLIVAAILWMSDHATLRDQLVIRILLGSGARLHEVLGLTAGGYRRGRSVSNDPANRVWVHRTRRRIAVKNSARHPTRGRPIVRYATSAWPTSTGMAGGQRCAPSRG
jgi:predicted ATPase